MQSSTATPSYSHANSSVPAMHTTAQAADANTVLMPQADIQATVEYYCRQVRREINSYGLEKAMERWRVVCDYHMEIEWWYLVVREVDVILYDVRGKVERQRQEASRQAAQPQASVIVNVSMLNCKEVGQLALGNYGTMSNNQY